MRVCCFSLFFLLWKSFLNQLTRIVHSSISNLSAVTPTSVVNMAIFPIFPNLPFKNRCVTNLVCGHEMVIYRAWRGLMKSSCIMGTVGVSIFGTWPSIFTSLISSSVSPLPWLYWSTSSHHQNNSLSGVLPSQTSSPDVSHISPFKTQLCGPEAPEFTLSHWRRRSW